MTESCAICGQPKTSGMTGSFTQWVNACHCDLADSGKDRLPICSLCGKQINETNTGSFTQWVLQSQNCACPQPVPLDAEEGKPIAESAPKEVPFQRRATSEIADLDVKNFPLGRYKPQARLGMGGGGSVYLCFDKHLRKNVAVKIIRVHTPDQVAQFQSEAKVTAKFKHPNVVQIIDFGITDGGAPFMVLEYVDGQPLDQLLAKHGPLPQKLAIELFIQIASALEKGHQSNIFHRDIKCSNIIITEQENGEARAQVIDFGIALMTDHVETRFNGKTIVGTPKYMPPDQVLGKPFDARSEIYSLGCVMYEALSGNLPFSGEAMILLQKHARERPPSLREANPNVSVSPKLESIVMRCLEKEKDNRFNSMTELKSRLTACKQEDLIDSSSLLHTVPPDSESEIETAGLPGEKRQRKMTIEQLYAEFPQDKLSNAAGEKTVDGTMAVIISIADVVLVFLIASAYLILRHEPDPETVLTRTYLTPVEQEKIELEKRRAKLNTIDDYNEEAVDGETPVDFSGMDKPTDLHLKADALSKVHHYKNAEAASTRALEIDPVDPIAYRQRGLARMHQGKYDEAKADFDKAVSLKDSNLSRKARALYYLNCGLTEEALQDITAALNFDRNDLDTLTTAAMIIEESREPSREQLQQAQGWLVRALELDDESACAYAARMLVALRLGSFDGSKLKDAREYYESAIKYGAAASEPGPEPVASYCVGKYRYETGDYEGAKIALSQAIKRSPSMWQAYFLRGMTWASLSRQKSARIEGQEFLQGECVSLSLSNFEEACELNPENPDILFEMSKTYGSLNRFQDQIHALDKAIALRPADSTYLRNRAEAYLGQGMNEPALRDLDKCIALGNKSDQVFHLKGTALARLGRKDEAAEVLKNKVEELH